MARKLYYTLLTRMTNISAWGIEFGDYDRKVVQEEADEMWDQGMGRPKKNLKIIATTPDQATITQTVDDLNAELAQVL